MEERSFEDEHDTLRDRKSGVAVELEERQLERRVDGLVIQKMEMEEEVEDVTECTPEYEKLYSFDSFSWNETFEGLPDPVQCLLETVLSVPATEAVCERFLRQTSLTVKRQLVTTLFAV